ncbi:hypothetical protein [Roseibium sediminicola]|uniref:NHLP leader peptide family natural product n=1 Tax=Roseibium sediminicola TaxID=2933272 RepID=A0ABT0H2M2_9HYPH|nr:hypothetical protein [Roseibium sp. CAU 1639]MCK7615919.1 hypothetical protein [Roseibium sp. CAU 1639]
MHVKSTTNSELILGAKLGAIIQDSAARTRLIENPTEVLAEVGARNDLTILADTADTVHLIIPANVDAARVAANDESYFEELGKAALGNCYYEDLPE